jgi:hypothetical protein
VRDIIEQAFPEEIAESKQVRLIHSGKKLDESAMLTDYDLKDGSKVHAIISMLHLRAATPSPDKTEEDTTAGQDDVPVFPEEPAMDDIYTQSLYQSMYIEDDRQNLIAGGMISDGLISPELTNEEDREGTILDFILGLVAGYLFSILAIAAMIYCKMNRKMRTGIIIGFTFCLMSAIPALFN